MMLDDERMRRNPSSEDAGGDVVGQAFEDLAGQLAGDRPRWRVASSKA